jgi:hypothetical protein
MRDGGKSVARRKKQLVRDKSKDSYERGAGASEREDHRASAHLARPYASSQLEKPSLSLISTLRQQWLAHLHTALALARGLSYEDFRALP